MSTMSTPSLDQLVTNPLDCCSALYDIVPYRPYGLSMNMGVWNPDFLDRTFGATMDNLYVTMIRMMNPRQHSWSDIVTRANDRMEDTLLAVIPVLHDLLEMGANPTGPSRFCGTPHVMWVIKFGLVEVMALFLPYMHWCDVMRKEMTHPDQRRWTPFFSGSDRLNQPIDVTPMSALFRYGQPAFVEFVLDHELRNPLSTLYALFRHDHVNAVSQTNMFHEVFINDRLIYLKERRTDHVLPFNRSNAVVLFRAIERHHPLFWLSEEAHRMMNAKMLWGTMTATPLILFAQMRYSERVTRELWSKIILTRVDIRIRDDHDKCAQDYASDLVCQLLSDMSTNPT